MVFTPSIRHTLSGRWPHQSGIRHYSVLQRLIARAGGKWDYRLEGAQFGKAIQEVPDMVACTLLWVASTVGDTLVITIVSHHAHLKMHVDWASGQPTAIPVCLWRGNWAQSRSGIFLGAGANR